VRLRENGWLYVSVAVGQLGLLGQGRGRKGGLGGELLVQGGDRRRHRHVLGEGGVVHLLRRRLLLLAL
jgi:hypothetical protein